MYLENTNQILMNLDVNIIVILCHDMHLVSSDIRKRTFQSAPPNIIKPIASLNLYYYITTTPFPALNSQPTA